LLFQKHSDNIEGSHDAQRLGVILSLMADCKDDAQQRSWALHEDEAIIKECLEELVSILVSKNIVFHQNVDIKHFSYNAIMGTGM
jgi:hypothetical protein